MSHDAILGIQMCFRFTKVVKCWMVSLSLCPQNAYMLYLDWGTRLLFYEFKLAASLVYCLRFCSPQMVLIYFATLFLHPPYLMPNARLLSLSISSFAFVFLPFKFWKFNTSHLQFFLQNGKRNKSSFSHVPWHLKLCRCKLILALTCSRGGTHSSH